ncbi:c-type cytochrome, partial [Escherichia coli]|nr:c-type cytochrome [Escherichia coli]
GSRSGTLGWTSAGEYRKEQQAEQQSVAPIYAAFDAKSPEQLIDDPSARALGERLFLSNCAQCHGSDARGSKGFPNLTDTDWLYGGDHETIMESIAKGRHGVMPPMAAAVGGAQDVRNVAHYVLSLSGSPHNAIAAQLGKAKFGACSACHGADGKGNQAL